MNSSWLTTPVALITEFQPVLVLWILAISFFVALAGVAVVSKGRPWGQIAGLFVVAYIVVSLLGVATATYLFDVQVVKFEVISSAASN